MFQSQSPLKSLEPDWTWYLDIYLCHTSQHIFFSLKFFRYFCFKSTPCFHFWCESWRGRLLEEFCWNGDFIPPYFKMDHGLCPMGMPSNNPQNKMYFRLKTYCKSNNEMCTQTYRNFFFYSSKFVNPDKCSEYSAKKPETESGNNLSERSQSWFCTLFNYNIL